MDEEEEEDDQEDEHNNDGGLSGLLANLGGLSGKGLFATFEFNSTIVVVITSVEEEQEVSHKLCSLGCEEVLKMHLTDEESVDLAAHLFEHHYNGNTKMQLSWPLQVTRLFEKSSKQLQLEAERDALQNELSATKGELHSVQLLCAEKVQQLQQQCEALKQKAGSESVHSQTHEDVKPKLGIMVSPTRASYSASPGRVTFVSPHVTQPQSPQTLTTSPPGASYASSIARMTPVSAHMTQMVCHAGMKHGVTRKGATSNAISRQFVRTLPGWQSTPIDTVYQTALIGMRPVTYTPVKRRLAMDSDTDRHGKVLSSTP